MEEVQRHLVPLGRRTPPSRGSHPCGEDGVHGRQADAEAETVDDPRAEEVFAALGSSAAPSAVRAKHRLPTRVAAKGTQCDRNASPCLGRDQLLH